MRSCRARWLGADEPVRYRDAMAGLMKGQGNVVLADGSAHFSTDADLGSYGQFTVQHHRSSGGIRWVRQHGHARLLWWL